MFLRIECHVIPDSIIGDGKTCMCNFQLGSQTCRYISMDRKNKVTGQKTNEYRRKKIKTTVQKSTISMMHIEGDRKIEEEI